MNWLHFGSYFTFLSRNKAYTAINVFGLSISLAFAMFVGLYYERITGMDKDIPGGENLYGLEATIDGSDVVSGTSRELIAWLQKRHPQVLSGCGFKYQGKAHIKGAGEESVPGAVLFTDSTYMRLFSPDLKEGNARGALANENDALISETLANSLFPDGDAVGRTVKVDNFPPLRVRGIFRNDPGRSLPDVGVIARFELLRESLPYYFQVDGNFGDAEIVLQVKPGTDIGALSQQINRELSALYSKIFHGQVKVDFVLKRFDTFYFSDCWSPVFKRDNPFQARMMLFVGLVLLVIAMMNYVNLTMAQAGYRAREMATRRLMGSTKADIRKRMFSESLLLCTFSMALAVVPAALFIPAANRLLGTEMSVSMLFTPLHALWALVLLVVVGALSGLLPAMMLARPKPIDVVRGTVRMKFKMRFSRVFIIFQNVVTLILLSVSIFVNRQMSHLLSQSPGYDINKVMHLSLMPDSTKNATFKSELLKLPVVESASLCSGAPITGGYNQMANKGKVRCQRFYVDKDYFRVLGIKLVESNGRTSGLRRYVSPNFTTLMELPGGSRSFQLYEGGEVESIDGTLPPITLGVVGHEEGNRVTLIYVSDEFAFNLDPNIVIKVKGDPAEAYREVNKLYRKVYHERIDDSGMPYLEQQFTDAYADLNRVQGLAGAFAFVSLVISLLGLVAMSTYYIRLRAQQMAVRKVFGATSRQIERLLLRSFLGNVLAGIVLGIVPLWYIMAQWQMSYTQRIAWWPWSIVAAAIMLAISLTALYWQSRKAARENPINNIKQE